MLDHVALDELPVEHGLAHDPTEEAEVDEMVLRARNFCAVSFFASGRIIVPGFIFRTDALIGDLFGGTVVVSKT
jgi:hypothetical protein